MRQQNVAQPRHLTRLHRQRFGQIARIDRTLFHQQLPQRAAQRRAGGPNGGKARRARGRLRRDKAQLGTRRGHRQPSAGWTR